MGSGGGSNYVEGEQRVTYLRQIRVTEEVMYTPINIFAVPYYRDPLLLLQ